jgi:hypothetical protein
MKKFHFRLIFIIVLTISVILPLKGFAGSSWVLYDNFNSGSINLDRWDVDDSSAEITIEGGRAKFVHYVSMPGDSSWLIFKKNPEKIREIRVKVWVVQAPDGDPRARIAGWVGKDEDGYPIWNHLQVRPEHQRVDCWAGALDGPPNYDIWVYDLFFAFFKTPIEILNKRFKLTLGFDRDELEYEESHLGEIELELEDELERTDEVFKGIGTRNNYAGTGEFIVYFDDVYVRYSD